MPRVRSEVRPKVRSDVRPSVGPKLLSFIVLQDSRECLLRHLNRTELTHTLLALLLLFKELFLSCDIAAVAFGKDILAHRLYGFSGNNLAADGSLYGNLKELSGDIIL